MDVATTTVPSSNSFANSRAQDHRVGNIGDVKFVEAEQPGLVENRRRGQRDHIAVSDFAARDLLAKAVDALVHLGHEFVEMGAALVLDLALLEEQIHQHGLAAPDFAVNIKAARRGTVLVGKQPAQQPLPACRPVVRKPLVKRSKGFGDLRLRGVGLDRAGRHQRLIMGVE